MKETSECTFATTGIGTGARESEDRRRESLDSGSATDAASEGVCSSKLDSKNDLGDHLLPGSELLIKVGATFRKGTAIHLCFCLSAFSPADVTNCA